MDCDSAGADPGLCRSSALTPMPPQPENGQGKVAETTRNVFYTS